MTGDADALILVIGATGTQGGAVARQLLAQGRRVRILCRNPAAPAAQALIRAGAEAVRGDLDDRSSIDAALHGVAGVFSVQLTDAAQTDCERRHGFALIEAARSAGVRQLVHTSVIGNGAHARLPRWGTGYWNEKYWTDKWEVEEAARNAGFASWTVLRPAFIMENFSEPKVRYMFPQLRAGQIATAFLPETRIQLIAGDDIGTFAGAAFADPEKYNGRIIDLAAETLTMGQIAAILSKELGREIQALAVSPEEAVRRGLAPGWVRTQELRNEAGYNADQRDARSFDIPLTTFAQWVRQHRDRIITEH